MRRVERISGVDDIVERRVAQRDRTVFLGHPRPTRPFTVRSENLTVDNVGPSFSTCGVGRQSLVRECMRNDDLYV